MPVHFGLPIRAAGEQGQPELVIHIGFAKTGTSALQGLLVRERGTLRNLGVDYPDIGVRFNAHHGIAGLLIEHENVQIPEPEATTAELLEYLDTSVPPGTERIVLSSEGLSTARAIRPVVGSLQERFSVRVVAAVRPVLGWVNSLLNQLSKTAMFRPQEWDQLAVTRQILRQDARFDQQLLLWEEAVGADSLTITVLGVDDDYLLADLAAIGLDSSLAARGQSDDTNRSAGLDELHFLEWFSTLAPEPDHDQKVRVARWLRTYQAREPYSLIHPDVVDEAMRVADQVRQGLSERYFGGQPLLEEEFDPSLAVATQPPDLERVLRVAAHVLSSGDLDRRRLVRALEAARSDQPGT